MSFSDKTLTCRDCGLNFIFTIGEQQFYSAKGFQHEPSRCPDCRSINRNVRGTGRAKELHEVICAECGKPAQVPFTPTMGRPVYCSDCFDKVRATRRQHLAAVRNGRRNVPGAASEVQRDGTRVPRQRS